MEVYLSILATIGVIAFSVGQFKLGRKKKSVEDTAEADNTIKLLQARTSVLEKELVDSKAQQQKHHDEIIRLQEAIKHKDQLIEQYLKLIANRNPELEQVLKDVRNYLRELVMQKKGEVVV